MPESSEKAGSAAGPENTSGQTARGMNVALMPDAGVSCEEIEQITEVFARLVADGAALGWVDPPGHDEIAELIGGLAAATATGDARAAIARVGDGSIVGIAYWTRYQRPTHRPHADIEKVAVDPRTQGAGIGRELMNVLVTSARDIGVEVITLDLRGDNGRAIALYESLGFERYGLLGGFVAVGDQRFDMHLFALDLRIRALRLETMCTGCGTRTHTSLDNAF